MNAAGLRHKEMLASYESTTAHHSDLVVNERHIFVPRHWVPSNSKHN